MRNIIIGVTLSLVLCSSCFSDDTNTDYKDLVKPVLVVDKENPQVFVENKTYEVTSGQKLILTAKVDYPDMADVEYEWFINGKSVSTTENMEWTCDISEDKASGTLLVKRVSAQNADVYGFLVLLSKPFQRGWMVMDKEGENVRIHMIEEKVANPQYLYTPYMNVIQGLPGGVPVKLLEYWSCESSKIMGEILFLDKNPMNCFNLSGESFAKTVEQQEEWIEENIPANIKYKDAIYCGFVDYLLGTDGKLYMRKNGLGYYTGRFSDLPVQFEGKELNVSHVIPCKHDSKMALIFDSGKGRFLLINTDYDWGEYAIGLKAGEIYTFPEDAGLNNLKGYEILVSKSIKPAGYGENYVYFCVLKTPGGTYEAMEFSVDFNGVSKPSAEMIYSGVSFPAAIGPDSKFCILNDPYYGMLKSCVYFTIQRDPKTLYCVERTSSGFKTPSVYKQFEQDILSLDHGKLGSRNATIGIGLKNGTLQLYNLTKGWYKAVENSFVTEIPGFGEIVDVTFKYGTASSL